MEIQMTKGTEKLKVTEKNKILTYLLKAKTSIFAFFTVKNAYINILIINYLYNTFLKKNKI